MMRRAPSRILVWIVLPLFLSACARKSRPPAVITPPAPSPVALLQQGETHFEAGDFAAAAIAYDEYLRTASSPESADRALFRLGIAYAVTGSSPEDLRRAWAVFEQLVRDFPRSPYRVQADFILRLQAETQRLRADVRERDERLKRLSAELERLKKIDLKRRPTRPPD